MRCPRSRAGFGQRKLAVDFAWHLRLGGHMDDKERELIVQLCTKAGMVMEDASVVALSIGRFRDEVEVRCELARLEEVASRIDALIRAAARLCD